MERELKYALSARHFQALLRRFRGSARVQVNWYFHGRPDGALARGGAMLRLRQEPDGWVLAFKGGLAVAGDYFVSEEVEAPLADEEAARALDRGLGRVDGGAGPLARASAVDPAPRFEAAGFSRTERTLAPLGTGDDLVLDASTFPGDLRDFEAEVETENPDRVRAALDRLARELDVAFHPQERTKYRRFLDALGEAH